MRPGVDLDDPPDRPVEEGAIVRDDGQPAVEAGQEALEPLQTVEVEVVRRLVEQEQVEAREENRGQAGSRRLAAGKGRRRLLERDVEPELGADGAGSMLEIAATEREEALERRAVGVGLPRLRVPLDRRLRLGDPGSALEVGAERLRGTPVVLLRQVADGQRRRRPLDAAFVRQLESGEEPQQRRLAGAVPADDAEPRARPERQIDAIEDEVGAVCLDDAGERDSHGRYLLRERGRAPAGGAEDVDVLVQSVMGGRRSATGILQPVAEALERRPARIAGDILVRVRLDVQVLAADRAETGAVGVVEDLIRQRERDRVASPGRQLELIVDHVLAPKLLVALRGRRVVLPRVDADVERGVCEAAHARPVQAHRKAQLEEQAGRRLRDRELGLDRLRDGEIALPAELERLELDLDRVALHLA